MKYELVGVSSTLSVCRRILVGSTQIGPQVELEQQTRSLSQSPSGQLIVELNPQRDSASELHDSEFIWKRYRHQNKETLVTILLMQNNIIMKIIIRTVIIIIYYSSKIVCMITPKLPQLFVKITDLYIALKIMFPATVFNISDLIFIIN